MPNSLQLLGKSPLNLCPALSKACAAVLFLAPHPPPCSIQPRERAELQVIPGRREEKTEQKALILESKSPQRNSLSAGRQSAVG